MFAAPNTSEELGTLVRSFLFTVVEPLLHRESMVSLFPRISRRMPSHPMWHGRRIHSRLLYNIKLVLDSCEG